MLARLIVCTSLLVLGVHARAELSNDERRGLDQALYLANLVHKDLRVGPAEPGDPLATLALSHPLDAIDRLFDLHILSTRDTSSILTEMGLQAGIPAVTVSEGFSEAIAPRRGLPNALRLPLARLVAAVRTVNAEAESLHLKVPPDALARLQAVSGSAGLESQELGPLLAASVLLNRTVEDVSRTLRRLAPADQPKGLLKVDVRGISVWVGGPENQLYDGNPDIVVDFGGNDRYLGLCGVGKDRSRVILDIAGNDTYSPTGGVATGHLGVGLVRDLAGDDTYISNGIGIGAACGGVGVLIDESGDDRYIGGSRSLGFALFGLGLLLDNRGDDRYLSGSLSQGAGSEFGFGWLIDREGRDAYRIEGEKQSVASGGQGYGKTRGLGLLTDLSGDDTYVAGVWAQAVGRNQGLGSLYDAKGADTYRTVAASQGFATNFGTAMLLELDGDDAYICRRGDCHASASSGGVAFVLERSGDDLVVATDSRPANATWGGLSIWLDALGNDRYLGPVGEGAPYPSEAAIALFVDLSGEDTYEGGVQDGLAMRSGAWGSAWDQSGTAEAIPEFVPEPGSRRMPGPAELRRIYAAAINESSYLPKIAVVKARNDLVAFGLPALEQLLKSKTDLIGRRDLEVLSEMTLYNGELGSRFVLGQLESALPHHRANALQIAATARLSVAAPLVLNALEDPATRIAAIEAVSRMKLKEAVPALLSLCATDDPAVQLGALRALAEIPDPAAAGTAQALVRSEDIAIRRASVFLLSKFPHQALVTARQLAVEIANEPLARTGVQLLGWVGTPEAIRELGGLLSSPLPGIRIEALYALRGRVPQEFVAAYSKLRDDPDPRVRAVARGE